MPLGRLEATVITINRPYIMLQILQTNKKKIVKENKI